MRPGRIFLFLLSVIITLFLLRFGLTNRDRAAYDIFPSLHNDSISATGQGLHEQKIVAHAGQDDINDSIIIYAAQPRRRAGYLQPSPADLIRDSIEAGKQVRIMYYGDSQLEGDRVTSIIREDLRQQYGGTGPGLISPVMPVMYTNSYVIKPSSNWRRYTLLDYRNGTLKNNRLGPLHALSRFTLPGKSELSPVYASLRIAAVPGCDSAAARYDRLRFFYGNNNDTVFAGVRSGSTMYGYYFLTMGRGPYECSVALPGVSDVTIEFTGRSSPDIYALSLESDSGIIVDNIPVRGSAGLEFVMTDSVTYGSVISMLKPDIIILQYGLNVVRNVRSEYHYYEEGLVRQIEFLKRITGGTPVILASLTDMADRVGDTIRPFNNIPAIRDAQKSAAARTGIIFWDTWKEMGGSGSIVRWFESDPPLASKDLTHLTSEGADTLGALFARKMMLFPAEKRAVTIPVADADTGIVPVKIAMPVTTGDPVVQKPQKSIGMLFTFLRYHPQQTFIFTAVAFWIFFVVVLAGFALLRRKRAVCHLWLLLVSLYFYYRVGGLFIILLVVTTLITYGSALLIANSTTKGKRRFWLTINIIILLGFLSYFKYAGFITETVNLLFKTSFRTFDIFSALSNSLFGSSFNTTVIILPVGISFFTFQALSYSIDVFRDRMTPVKNIVDFSFYLTFFPQLVAGPIVRASEFIPQMQGEYSITRNEFGHALFLILQGLIKKMLISDFISVGLIDRVFDSPAVYSGFENLMAVYGYGLQIYCDFSGYTDIAIGVALLLGFRLPLNFNSPYKASDISEFWRRWHISLSRWLKDYLYIPLGGSRRGRFRTGLNLMITMLLGGLWHGAALRFILWGGLHGIALVINRIWKHIFRSGKRGRPLAQLAGIFITFNFVSFAWIFFRSPSMENTGVMLSQMFNNFSPGDYNRVLMAYLPVLVLIISGYILHFLPVTVKEAYRGLFIRLPVVVKFLVVIVVAVLLYKVGTGVVQPFIYFRF